MSGAARVRLPGRLRRLPFWRTLLVVVVVAIVTVGLVGGLRHGSSAAPSTQKTGTHDNRTLLGILDSLDPGMVRAVGSGGLPNVLVPVRDAPELTGASKHPQVIFVAAEGCGLCAAQRWSVVIALSRFGTMKDVLLAASSPGEPTGSLATFSFRSLVYASRYVNLVAIETTDVDGHPLTALTADGQQLVDKYDAPPFVPAASRGGVPWLDVANRYVMSGSGYPADVLRGLSWAQIAERLGNAGDPVTKAIVGNANWISAAICRATGMSPATVCQASPVVDMARQLG